MVAGGVCCREAGAPAEKPVTWLTIGVVCGVIAIVTQWIRPQWLPRGMRHTPPGLAILVFTLSDFSDRTTLTLIRSRVGFEPNSPLRITAPFLTEFHPRPAILLPPSFVGSPGSPQLVLKYALALAVGVTIALLARPDWLPFVRRIGEKLLHPFLVLSALWFSGLHARALNAIQSDVRLHPDAPLSSIAAVAQSVRTDYEVYALVCFIVLALFLYIEGLRFVMSGVHRAAKATQNGGR